MKLIANRKPLIDSASEQAVFFARTVDIGQFFVTNDDVVDGNCCSPICSEYSELRNSQISRLRAILIDHVEIGTVTEIEVFESAGPLIIEVRVPSRETGTVKSWGTYLARWRAVRTTIDFLKILNTKVLNPCSRLSLRAGGDCEHRRKVNSHR